MSYGLVTPCANCPFRTDIKPYLRKDRVREILTHPGEFWCHKTVNDDESNGVVCAGFMIVLEHDQNPSQMMRIAKRLGLYDRTKLRMDAPVYRGIKAALKAHTR